MYRDSFYILKVRLVSKWGNISLYNTFPVYNVVLTQFAILPGIVW